MDLLKKENGTTIIESLVVILLLGILVTLTAMIFISLLLNPNMLRSDALRLAHHEIDKTIAQQAEQDTTYTNEQGNLKVHRFVSRTENVYQVEVAVSKNSSDSTLILLKAAYSR